MVEAHGIDERSEWRTFGDKARAQPLRRTPRTFVSLARALSAGCALASARLLLPCLCVSGWEAAALCELQDKESVDPTRVGGPSNHLLTDGGLSLVIGDATKGTGNATLTQVGNLFALQARRRGCDLRPAASDCVCA